MGCVESVLSGISYGKDGMNMEKFVERCVAMMETNGIIEERERQIMVYGLDLLFMSAVSIGSFLFLGFLLNSETKTICLLLSFIPLQSFGGGYHCQTHARCWLLMMCGYLIGIFFLINVPGEVLWCSAAVCSVLFLRAVPIENPRAPFSAIFARKMRKIAIGVYFFVLGISAITFLLECGLYKALLAGIILSGLSILCAALKKVSITL